MMRSPPERAISFSFADAMLGVLGEWFPSQAPKPLEGEHDLDHAAFRQLARKIDLTGGHIRQITLRAAFIAAAADVRINLTHIADAARAEFAKLGMPPVEIDLNVGRRAA